MRCLSVLLRLICTAEFISGTALNGPELQTPTTSLPLTLPFQCLKRVFQDRKLLEYSPLDKQTAILTGTDRHSCSGNKWTTSISYNWRLDYLSFKSPFHPKLFLHPITEIQDLSQRGDSVTEEPKNTYVGILLIFWKCSIMFLFKRKQKNNFKTTGNRNRQIFNLLDEPPLKHR